MKLDGYTEKKESLLNLLNEIYNIAAPLNMDNIINDVKKDMTMLKAENFQLVVVGEFSRGKSTFVNAMLGRRILPSSIKPTTAVISKISYDDEPTYKLHYRNSNMPVQEISAEKFSELIAPKETNLIEKIQAQLAFNKQSELDSISYAEIGYPLDFCRENVNVVDTPGTNDLNAGRIEITYNYVEKADAVILVLAANNPLTASELEFLKERVLGNQIKDIFFIINYKDALNSHQEEEVVKNYINDNLHEKLPELPANLKMYMVSSLQALLYRRQNINGEILKPRQLAQLPEDFNDTGFPEFEKSLGEFLANDKGKAKINKYAERGSKISHRIYEDINLRLEMSTKSLDEITAQYNKLEPAFKNAQKEVKRVIRILKDNLENGVEDISNECTIAGNKMRNAANSVVDSYSGSYNEDEIKQKVNRAVHEKINKFIRKVSKKQQDLFDDQMEYVNSELKKIWNDVYINYNSNAVSSIDYKADFDLDISVSSSTSSQDSFGGACAGAIIGGLLGGPIGFMIGGFFGSFLGSGSSRSTTTSVRHSINMSFNNNTESMRKNVVEQYRKNVNRICSDIDKSVNNRIDDMRNQLNAVMKQKNDAKIDTDALQKDLESRRVRIKNVFSELNRLQE